MHTASREGDESTIVQLLSKGYPISIKDEVIESRAIIRLIVQFLRTPLHIAARFGHESLCELLLERGADLHAAAKVS